MSDNVYIIGIGMVKFGKFLDRSIKQMTGMVLEGALKDCGLTREDIQAAWFSNTAWGIYSFQHSIRGQVAFTANGIQAIPITNVENACASASTALHGAWVSIKAGLYDCCLAVGAEKLYDEDRAKVMGGFMAGTDVEVMTKAVEALREQEQKRREQEAKEKGTQVQEEKAGGHSAFMDFYAAGARAHMQRYGSTQRQLACIAAKNHNNSTLNPLAQYTFPQTVEQVMNDRVVSYPLTRAMCAPIGDGAAAAIVVSESFLKKHPTDHAVLIRASVLEGGRRFGSNDVAERAAKRAWAVSGLGPQDVDVMEVHDATAFGEIAAM
jgi:acetyl-CoA acyltransferase